MKWEEMGKSALALNFYFFPPEMPRRAAKKSRVWKFFCMKVMNEILPLKFFNVCKFFN